MRLQDRTDGGRQLATHLRSYRGRSDVLVVAIRPGGLPVALEVARGLSVPLDVLPVAAIEIPGPPDHEIGALTAEIEVLDERRIAALEVPRAVVEQAASRSRLALERNGLRSSGALPPLTADHTIIVVEDGLADAAFAEAAVLALRKAGSARVIVAAPTRRSRLQTSGLPTFGDMLLGIISMNDILLAAGPDRPVRSEEVVDTLQAICGHHHPVPHVVAA